MLPMTPNLCPRSSFDDTLFIPHTEDTEQQEILHPLPFPWRTSYDVIHPQKQLQYVSISYRTGKGQNRSHTSAASDAEDTTAFFNL